MNTLLHTVLAFIESKFAYVFTAVSGAFTTILSEIPDDEIAIVHAAMLASGNVLKAGGSAEEAITAGLNSIKAGEGNEWTKVKTALLEAFVHGTTAQQSGG